MMDFDLPSPEQSATEKKLPGAEDYRQAWTALQSAKSRKEKEAAISHAMSLGVALSEIEALLDWLDAVAKEQPAGAKKPIVMPAPWASRVTAPRTSPSGAAAAPHFGARQPPGDSFA
jgi:hypothetical protein